MKSSDTLSGLCGQGFGPNHAPRHADRGARVGGLGWSVLAALLGAILGQAQTVVLFHPFDALNLPIPDGDPLGVSYTANLAFPASQNEIQDVNVILNLEGGSNGDLYVQLTHGSGFSVLLNRPGRRAGEPLGYDDPGMQVTFDDDAGLGDVHGYRLALNGNHMTPLGRPLTGTWVPDGRVTDPAFTLDTDTPTQRLSALVGADPNGAWTLYLLDAEPGDETVLVSWGLELTLVPEPAATALVTALGLGALVFWRRRRSASVGTGEKCAD